MKADDYLSPDITITLIGMEGFLCASLINEKSTTEFIIEGTPEDYEEME